MSQAPKFWNAGGEASFAAKLLSPLASLYAGIVARKLAKASPYRANVPVICVGNVTMGGVGKTPFTAHLVERLLARGERPMVLTRGYGGSEKGPIRVGDQHTAAEVGDEALLLARTAPVIVSADRPAGAQLAVNQGATIIVMDDGFQNPSLHKDLSFVLIDAGAGLGNGKVFPAGPLREAPANALARADAVVVVNGAATHEGTFALPEAPPLLTASLRAVTAGIGPDERLFAFCGIGRPAKFFDDLRAQGLELTGFRGFPDHHPYSDADLDALQAEASGHRARLVTTEKDFVRLPPEFREQVTAIPAALSVAPEEGLDALLATLPRIENNKS